MRRLVALVLGHRIQKDDWDTRRVAAGQPTAADLSAAVVLSPDDGRADIPDFVRRTPADDPSMVAARRALGIEDGGAA